MKKIFPLIYCFLIISYFFIGQLPFLGTSLNYNIVSTIFTFACCCIFEKPMFEKWMKLYFVFIAFYTLSSLVTGGFDVFSHKLYSVLLISYTGYWSTSIMVRYYGTLTPLIYTIIIVGVVDATVTSLQALGISFYNPLLSLIIEDSNQEEYLAMHDNEMGFAISGLYVNPVFNGHHLLFFLLVSLLTQYENIDLKTIVFPFIIWIGLFFCQQRSAFYMGSIALLYVIYKRILLNNKYRLLMVALVTILLLFVVNYMLGIIMSSGSRLSETSGTGRNETFSLSIDFLSSNIVFGGFDLFIKTTHEYPHNLILSSYIAGGIIGGTILMILVFEQMKFLFNVLCEYKYVLFNIIAFLYASMIFDSMLHNTGLVEMDFSTFVAWGLMSSIMKEENGLKLA